MLVLHDFPYRRRNEGFYGAVNCSNIKASLKHKCSDIQLGVY